MNYANAFFVSLYLPLVKKCTLRTFTRRKPAAGTLLIVLYYSINVLPFFLIFIRYPADEGILIFTVHRIIDTRSVTNKTIRWTVMLRILLNIRN